MKYRSCNGRMERSLKGGGETLRSNSTIPEYVPSVEQRGHQKLSMFPPANGILGKGMTSSRTGWKCLKLLRTEW